MLEDRRIRPVGADREIPIDVRFIFSTSKNLVAEVKNGTFGRISTIASTFSRCRFLAFMTAALMCWSWRRASCVSWGCSGLQPIPIDERTGISSELLVAGNVRELHNYVERSLILGHFPTQLERLSHSLTHEAGCSRRSSAGTSLQCFETGGDRERAATILGISRKTIDRKCSSWNVSA